jgi:hypothetical protein
MSSGHNRLDSMVLHVFTGIPEALKDLSGMPSKREIRAILKNICK